MNFIIKFARRFSKKSRERRASIFRGAFHLDENTKNLDLGSENGSNIYSVLQGTTIRPENVYIADINLARIKQGEEMYGYIPVLISECGKIPFEDQFFDIVYCSSVIEHVTVPKKQVWTILNDEEFREKAKFKKQRFSRDIKRLGKQYFVQTPSKYFPIESHSWLPGIAWLPRKMLIPLLKFTNKNWVKKTQPDWYLLNKSELSELFQEAEIVVEKSYGMTKSFMAISSLLKTPQAR